MFQKLMKTRQGFTLIELLVVVLILAILMAVALPLYLSTVHDSHLKACRANMQTIANAIQTARVQDVAATDYSAYTGKTVKKPDHVGKAARPRDLPPVPHKRHSSL